MSSNSPPPTPTGLPVASISAPSSASTPAQVLSSGINVAGATTTTSLTLVSQPQQVVVQPTATVSTAANTPLAKAASPQTASAADDAQPVDLKKTGLSLTGVTPLKIPAVPQRPVSARPAVGNIAYRASGPPMPMTATRPSTIVSVPKPGSQVSVPSPSPTPPRLATTTTTVIRTPQVGAYPMTIRAPAQSPTTASIRLTTAAVPTSNSMQFVPVSLATVNVRPTTVSTAGGNVAVRPAPPTFRPTAGTIVRQAVLPDSSISPVRVTLMPQPGGVKVGQAHSGSGQQTAFYKPATITAQNPPTSMATVSGPVRLGAIPNSRLAVVPASSQNLTVSMTSSGISVPMATAHNLITSKVQTFQSQQQPRLPGNVAVPMVSSGGVTIQKATTIGGSGSIPVSVGRTIALPYGTTSSIVTSIAPHSVATAASHVSLPNSGATITAAGKVIATLASAGATTTTLNAIPVARVCPQPLSGGGGGTSNNLVTISTSNPNASGQDGSAASVFITRTNSGNAAQQLAINLSTSGPGQQQQFSANNGSNVAGGAGKGRPNVITNLNLPKVCLPPQATTRIISFPGQQLQQQQQQHSFLLSTADGSHPQSQQVLEQHRGFPTNSPRPSILGRGEGEREHMMPGSPTSPPPRPDSRDDASSSSSGSTTLSATSSPDGAGGGHLSGGEEPAMDIKVNDQLQQQQASSSSLEPSPRKKPRKQQLASVRERLWSESEDDFQSNLQEELKRKNPHDLQQQQQQVQPREPEASYIRDKPRASLLTDYRPNWKSRHNHFLRHSDVRAKDERRPTVNELSNQKFILQKINGWKVYYLTSQMEDIIDIEVELTQRLCDLQKRLEKAAHPDIAGKEVSKTLELIKANLQRSKVIQDQMSEARENALEVFEHKPKITSILHKYESKRNIKKRFEPK